MTKTEFQATTVIVFWAVNLLKFIPYGMGGIYTQETLVGDMYLAPFALAGVATGVRFHRLVPEKLFFAITYVVLVLAGAKLIWDGLT